MSPSVQTTAQELPKGEPSSLPDNSEDASISPESVASAALTSAVIDTPGTHGCEWDGIIDRARIVKWDLAVEFFDWDDYQRTVEWREREKIKKSQSAALEETGKIIKAYEVAGPLFFAASRAFTNS